jgi:hypothetical protein
VLVKLLNPPASTHPQTKYNPPNPDGKKSKEIVKEKSE